MENPENKELNTVVEITNVIKTYTMGDNLVQALKGISFKIHQGEFVSIMGPSGSGKSTCMNMIGCLDKPTSGKVEINGKETAKMSEKELAILRNQTIGFIFQQYHLIPSMTILENVMLPLKYRKLDKKERMEKSKEALRLVGLEKRMNHRPFELSGGQKQRAAIARAMVTEPKILLADEPTGALDTETGHQVMNMFREINKKDNTTIIIVTHDPRIGRSTERCIHILDGEIKSDTLKKDTENLSESFDMSAQTDISDINDTAEKKDITSQINTNDMAIMDVTTGIEDQDQADKIQTAALLAVDDKNYSETNIKKDKENNTSYKKINKKNLNNFIKKKNKFISAAKEKNNV